jgi:hypothetical protein
LDCSGEEIVKRQLQTVAEGVAVAVLQSSISGGNNMLEKEKEAFVQPSKADFERVMDAKVEVTSKYGYNIVLLINFVCFPDFLNVFFTGSGDEEPSAR